MRNLLVGYGEDGGVQVGPDDLVRYVQGPLQLTDDDLVTHVHGVGASRTGKSKLIEWIARDWIQNRQGFCLIDPHGHLYNDLLSWLTYIGCAADVVLLNPSYGDRVVGFNPFQRGSGDQGARVDRLIKTTLRAWGATDADETPRLERWLRCIYHPMVEQGHSLEAVRYLMSWKHKEIREHITSSITVDVIQDEWDGLAGYKKAAEFDGQLESSRNRLFRFLTNRPVRRMMGLPFNNIDIEDIIASGKILLVNLQPSDSLSEENARLLGSLLLNEIWEVGKRRVKPSGGRRLSAFPVVVDEFQKFLTPDIPLMLNEAAKYGIHLFLFHQHLSQLRQEDEKFFASVMTNARIKIVFGGLMRDDAILMARELFPGQIDLRRVKLIIEQTKFWPVYMRDVVRSSTHATGQHAGTSAGMTSGVAWDPSLLQWIPTSAELSGQVDAGSESWGEGTADIPIFYPVPFKEVSSVQLYSLEEMLWMLSDRLMEQYQRHFIIRRPGQPTIAAITPKVSDWFVKPERLATYVEKRVQGFLTAPEVDAALAEIHVSLARAAGVDVGLGGDDNLIESSSGPIRRQKTAIPHQTTAARKSAAKQSASPPAADPMTESELVQRYRRVGLPRVDGLIENLRDAQTFFEGGKWKESMFNSRRALEGILSDVALKYSERMNTTIRPDPSPMMVRDYLEQFGILDATAKQLFSRAYSFHSEPMHPQASGGTLEKARLSLDLTQSFGVFVLERVEAKLASVAGAPRRKPQVET